MKRVNKWIKEYVVQGLYPGGHGWEDETSESTPKEARQRLREYRENSPYPSRLITRRVKNPEWKD